MRRGFVVAGRFEILEEAGEGGMGTVYRALDRLEGRVVALKVLRQTFVREAERFEHEARVLSELSHPAIVRYVAHGTTPLGQPYLVMEWLEGEDLAARIDRQPLDWSESLVVMRRVCTALAAAHARGLVHRDVKPGNVFLPGGVLAEAKLLDFGIVRDTRRQQRLTTTGVPMGTPEYMSPEQARGSRDPDARADVFALGCVLFELLTGQVPFEGESPMAVLAKVLLDAAPRPSDLRPELPPALDALLARMLAKDRLYRPADAGAVLEELELLERETAAVPPRRSRAPALTASERRVLSVLLVGEPDPERADTAPDYLARVVGELVAAHGGVVETLADGCLMAILRGTGAPTDQAVRAARCALAVRRHLPEVPMALATGKLERAGGVLVGELVDRIARGFDDESRLARDTVLDATELKPVRIDEVTASLLDDRFDVRAEPDGLRLHAERDSVEADRTLLGRPRSIIGRDAELATLLQAYGGGVAASRASGVLVVGPPGSGKSRLRRELVRRLGELPNAPTVLVGRGDFEGAGAPLSMLAGAVRGAAGILTSDAPALQREKLAAHLGRVVAEEAGARARLLDFLAELIDAVVEEPASELLRAARAEPRLMHDAMRGAWEDWLAAETVPRPVVLVLDDLQWADAATVEFVDAALRTLADRPFFLLALGRPELHARLPSLWPERDVVELALGPLSRDAAAALAREALGPAVAPELVERVVERADGNAFYLEELVRAVSEGRGEVLPESVVAMVQARLETAGDDARRVLRAASVFGRRFWTRGVAALLGEEVEPDALEATLAQLVSREILSRRATSAFAGEAELVFRSGLVRDAAYELLTEADRATGHRLAGEWLAAAGERDARVLAQHFFRGGDTARSLEAYRRAAAQALEACDFSTVLECVERALECRPPPETLGRLRLLQAEVLSWRGRHEDAREVAEQAAPLLSRGTTPWFQAIGQIFTSLANLGASDRLLPLALEVAAMKVPRADREAQIACLCRAAGPLIEAGRQEEARPLVERAELLALAAGRVEPATAARISRVRAVRALHLGDYAGYLRDIEMCVAQYEQAGHQRMVCTQQVALAYGRVEVGEPARGEELLRAVLASATRLDLPVVQAFAWQNLAYALLQQGRLDEARAAAERSLALATRLQVPRLEGGTRRYLGGIALAQGDLATAEREVRRAIDLLAHSLPLLPIAQATFARIELAHGAAEDALLTASGARALVEELGHVEEGESDVRLVYAQACWAAGQRTRALDAIRDARQRLLERARLISDEVVRGRFLHVVAANRDTLELAARWLTS